MANMVMEQLLPSLEKDMLPGLKAKKTERKRVWFAVSHLCLQLMQFLRNIGFHFPAVERKNEWKSVFQGYIWKSRALIHYSWSLRALFCTLGSHFYFLKKSWNSFKKRKNKKKNPSFSWICYLQMVEAVYILVQEDMFEGLSALKEECRVSVRQQEVLIHSDMDQILNSRRQLEEKIRGILIYLIALLLRTFRNRMMCCIPLHVMI